MELRVERIGKRYDRLWALQDVSFASGPGLIGLVGPNGAGKTTLMRILATLQPATQGHVFWDGRDIAQHDSWLRQRLGYLPQDYGLYPAFTGRQFLGYLAAMKGLPARVIPERVAEMLEVVHLERDADRPLGGYSGGMKQRIGIAQALLNDPELLIVDEPTAGLDPEERVRFRALLRSLVAERLVILSTHIISDIEAAADRVLLLREGRLIEDCTPERLIAAAVGRVWSLFARADAVQDLQRRHPITSLQTTTDGVRVRLVSDARPTREATPETATLEEAYLAAFTGARVQAS